jgi:UDP-glucuronate 4-epimerase
MTVLVTGVAGFVGLHVAEALLGRGDRVLGIDNLNDYYLVRLKEDRLKRLEGRAGFAFHRADIAEPAELAAALAGQGIDRIVHLAAQAGVRYSLENPFAYLRANLAGHLAVLEAARRMKGLRHLVYASSSSVYGGNTKLPFATTDPVDHPVSLYAATKKADELMSHTYAHLFGIPQTGLRFFTVYGPWGRPDMAYWTFTRAILEGAPIRVFNNGAMRRDFTYVDDVVEGVIRVLDRPPPAGGAAAPHRLYNIGNNRPEELMRFIAVIEAAAGRKAVIEMAPMQPGDVPATYADIADLQRDTGFAPRTPIDTGIPLFVDWYKKYHNLS